MHPHDLGTIRSVPAGDFLEIQMAKDDEGGRVVVKRMGGFFHSARKSWKIPLKGREPGIVSDLLHARVLEASPAYWPKVYPSLAKARCVTTRFGLVIGAAGARVRVPAGNRVEYVLKDIGAWPFGKEWGIPSTQFQDRRVQGIVEQVLAGDRELFDRSIDYLDGFALRGTIAMGPDDPLVMSVVRGATLGLSAAVPSFVDKKLGTEPVTSIPVVVAEAVGDVDAIEAKLDFLSGAAAYAATVKWVAGPRVAIDLDHLRGTWKRVRR